MYDVEFSSRPEEQTPPSDVQGSVELDFQYGDEKVTKPVAPNVAPRQQAIGSTALSFTHPEEHVTVKYDSTSLTTRPFSHK